MQNLSPASNERLRDRASEEASETVKADELKQQLADVLEETDPNFKSDLVYDGYRTIEESDNDALDSLDGELYEESTHDLVLKDREVSDIDSGEESLIDPQENRK